VNVVAGVDCHRETHTIVFLDAVGKELEHFVIPTTPEGYAEAIARARPYGHVSWGLEGTGSYGRAFADALLQTGAIVYEVPGSFTKRHRRHGSHRGKSDLLDAGAIAEVVLREAGRLPRCERSDEQEAMRLLYDRRDRLVRQRTEAINRLRSAGLRLGLAELPANLTTSTALGRTRELASTLRGTSYTTDVVIDELDEATDDIERLTKTIRALERQLIPFVERLAPGLLTLRGVSIVVAAGIIGHAGNLRNCRDASAFAMRAGVAPVPCSSGRSHTLRLNTGGNRQLNRCLHVAAITQIRSVDHAGRRYYDRKRTEGKTHRAATRALKRQLATVVFYRLTSSQRSPAADLIQSSAA